MLSKKGNSNKVFDFCITSMWWIISRMCRPMYYTLQMLQTLLMSVVVVHEDKVTIKEESSFCSVSLRLLPFYYLILTIKFFCFRMLVWTFNCSLEQLQTNTHWTLWILFSLTMRWGDIPFKSARSKSTRELLPQDHVKKLLGTTCACIQHDSILTSI